MRFTQENGPKSFSRDSIQIGSRNKKFAVVSFLLAVFVFIAVPVYPGTEGKSKVITNLQNREGLQFMENKGQLMDQNHQPNAAVKYLFCSPGFNVQLRQTGFSYDTYTEEADNDLSKSLSRYNHRVDIELQGCNPNAVFATEGKSKAYYNYPVSGALQGGISDVHFYSKVTYKNIYPNIDLEFFGVPANQESKSGKSVEYNFIVHPGGNTDDIKLSYKGDNKISLANDQLTVNVTAGVFTERIPFSYFLDRSCVSNERRLPVQVKYASLGNDVFAFSLPSGLGKFNSDLVIDPTPFLAWGTYYGGAGTDVGNAIAIDGSDNVYITGSTTSASAIATTGEYQTAFATTTDAFVAKFNPSGTTLLWGTYYGTTGSSAGFGIGLDASGQTGDGWWRLTGEFPAHLL